MGKPFAERVWGRWGLLASVVFLGAALTAASWSNYRNAREATLALHTGQARVFERAVAWRLLRREDEPRDYRSELDSLLADYRAEGLRYIGLVASDSTIAATAGEAAAAVDPAGVVARDARYDLAVLDSRVRVSVLRRPREDDDPVRHRPVGVVMEFDPLIAERLVEQARGLMMFGMAATVVMLGVAAVSWSMSRRYERAMRRLEDQRRLSLLGEMSAVLAHEIRNPLASLKGHAQLLAEKLPPESGESRKAAIVVREATRLEALTSDLLDFVRMGPVSREPVDPGVLVRTSIEEVDPEGFELEAGGAPPRWSLDADRMRQVLVNLLRNAQQASDPGAPAPVVTLGRSGSTLVIAVRDHGSGLPEGAEERIFDPFFTTRTTGTGLGLAVARRIVEHHGGTLSAADHPEGGAVFRIELPGERV